MRDAVRPRVATFNKLHTSLVKDETTAALEPTAVTYTHLFYTCLRAGNRLLAMARRRNAQFFFLLLVVSPASFFSECPSSTPQLRKPPDRLGDPRGDSPHERVPEYKCRVASIATKKAHGVKKL